MERVQTTEQIDSRAAYTAAQCALMAVQLPQHVCGGEFADKPVDELVAFFNYGDNAARYGEQLGKYMEASRTHPAKLPKIG